MTASDHVRVLGVTISLDLALEKHVSKNCTTGFCWLHQLLRIQRSLDKGLAATPVHAFVTSQIDYCNAIYVEAPKTITNMLQVLNAATQVVSDTKKFDCGLSTLLLNKLHWLNVPEKVTFKLGLMTNCCLYGQAPGYLDEHITPAIKNHISTSLDSANRHWLIIPHYQLNKYGCQAFPVVGMMV